MLINSHHQNIYNWTQGGGQFLALADHSSDGTQYTTALFILSLTPNICWRRESLLNRKVIIGYITGSAHPPVSHTEHSSSVLL